MNTSHSFPHVLIVDSHTGGEPTRTIIKGAPDLGAGSIVAQADVFRTRYSDFRRAVINEPRGSDVLVGALVCPSSKSKCTAGVIFFNNVDTLGMCGHGTIGLAVTLSYLGRIKPGEHQFETPVGNVWATLHDSNRVTVANVPSHRLAKDVLVRLPDGTHCVGDVAWGGNWFFLVSGHGQDLSVHRTRELTSYCLKARDAVRQAGFPEVDHVELFGAPSSKAAHSRNFVLCPGGAYDRSPCGTGTSAKLACLAADGKLAEDDDWIQESIIGSTFTGRFRWLDREKGIIAPHITGTAHITAETSLILDPADPFCWGISA